jgi:hypothetical protein
MLLFMQLLKNLRTVQKALSSGVDLGFRDCRASCYGPCFSKNCANKSAWGDACDGEPSIELKTLLTESALMGRSLMRAVPCGWRLFGLFDIR